MEIGDEVMAINALAVGSAVAGLEQLLGVAIDSIPPAAVRARAEVLSGEQSRWRLHTTGRVPCAPSASVTGEDRGTIPGHATSPGFRQVGAKAAHCGMDRGAPGEPRACPPRLARLFDHFLASLDMRAAI